MLERVKGIYCYLDLCLPPALPFIRPHLSRDGGRAVGGVVHHKSAVLYVHTSSPWRHLAR